MCTCTVYFMSKCLASSDVLCNVLIWANKSVLSYLLCLSSHKLQNRFGLNLVHCLGFLKLILLFVWSIFTLIILWIKILWTFARVWMLMDLFLSQLQSMCEDRHFWTVLFDTIFSDFDLHTRLHGWENLQLLLLDSCKVTWSSKNFCHGL